MMLILAYQVFYYMPRMRKVEEAKRAEQKALATGDSLGVSQTEGTSERPEAVSEHTPASPMGGTAFDEELPLAELGDARLITVRTPLYQLTMTTAGAEIVSARLIQFETEGEPVELLAQDEEPAIGGAANVTLVGENQSLVLSTVLFDAFTRASVDPLDDGAIFELGEANPEMEIVFRATTQSGGRVDRFYRFAHDSHVVQTGVRYSGGQFPFARSLRWGFGPGIQATEVNHREDVAAFRATLRLGDEYHRKKPGDFDENYSGMVHWAALQNRYFTMVMMPVAPSGGDAHAEGRRAEEFMTASIELPVSEKGGRVEETIRLYFGPLDFEILRAMDLGLEKNVEMGFKLFRPVSAVVLWCLVKLYKIIPNYGVVIILLSIFTKVLFYRLSHKSFKSMRDLQALQPKIQALKEKYGDDRQKLSQATMKLYKEAGVNPLGGCLPMLLQMPVFIALFNVLRNTIEVRQAPFVGWITDLSQQDVLFTMPFSLPFLGNAFSVLPLVMGVGMLLQSKIGGGLAGPSSSATQPKAFVYMMPILFTGLFYHMPSGLVLYWIVNTVLSVAQQWYINKGADVENVEAAKQTGRANTKNEGKSSKKKSKER